MEALNPTTKSWSKILLVVLFTIAFALNSNAQTPIDITGPDPVCEGDFEAYTADPVSGTYNWVVNNGTGSTSTTNTINILWGNAGTGTITVYVTDISGDTTHTGTLNVDIGPKPEPVITTDFNSACLIYEPLHDNQDTLVLVPDTCYKACDSTLVKYMVNNTSGSTWQWFVTGAISFTPNGNEVEVLWGAPGVGWVKVIETNSFGCSDSAEHCVRVIERPTAAFDTDPIAINGIVNICKGQTVYFTDQSVGTQQSPIMNWYWDFDNGYTSLNQNPSHTFDVPGTYTVMLIVTNMCNCKDTATVEIVVDSLRTPIIECAGTVCAGDTVTYSTPSACSTYIWTVTGGTVISGGGTNNNFIVIVWGSGSAGFGTISLEVPGCSGYCDVPNIIKIPIVAPNVGIIGPLVVCEFSQVQYTAPLMPGTVYTWSISGSAAIVHGQGTNEIVVQVEDVNFTIVVNYDNAFLDCGGSDTLQVTVLPEFILDGPVEACEGDNLTFTATASPSNSYTWQIINVNSLSNVYGPTSGTGTLNISSWSYGDGNFIVSATNTSGSYCNTTESIYLTVHPAPPPPDPAEGEILICPLQAYEYTAEPTSPNYFIQWQITGGTPASATGNTVSVLWGATGPYQVSVSQVSKNEPYCESAYVDLDVYLNTPNEPNITGDNPVCANSFGDYETDSIAQNYIWSIDPHTLGSIISGQGTQNISVQWNNVTTQQTATIMLIVENCGLRDTNTFNVTINPVNLPVISVTPNDTVCSGTNVNFSTNITTATGYLWNFGDGSPTSSSSSPNHIFTNTTQQPVTFFVTVAVTDPDGCIGVYSDDIMIVVYPQPLVEMTTVDPLDYCTGVSISTTFYVPNNTNTNYTFQWYLGGSPISGATNSSYTATATGTYLVIVTNTYGCTSSDSEVITQEPCSTTCTVYTPAPSITFSGSINSPTCTNVTFTYGIGSPFSFNYIIYGDGSQGTSTTHIYDAPGYYLAYLVASYDTFCDILTPYQIFIPLLADFNIELECYDSTAFTVNFIDLSTFVGATTNDWDWTIDDGINPPITINNTQNPSQVLTPGTYNVTLVISNGTNSCQITAPITVPQPASAEFSFTSPVCEKTPTVHFTDLSLGDNISWHWDFGDNATSLLQEPDRTYDNGTQTYDVLLSVLDKYGCTSMFELGVLVNANEIDGEIDPDYLTFCTGSTGLLTFTNNNPFSNITSYFWSNNATTSATSVYQTGNYTVTVTDDKGCSFTTIPAVVQVQHIPYPLIIGDLNYCIGDTIKLNANQGSMYTYAWTFNGSPASSTHLLEVPATTAGSFPAQVIISDGTCSDTASVTVTVHAIPSVPTLSYSPGTPLCEDEPILVSVTNNPTLLHNWSTGQSGYSITVYNAGLYAVTVTNAAGCTSSTEFQIHPQPNFDWLISGCYEFCDTSTIIIPGSWIVYGSWRWYVDGVVVASGTNSSVSALNLTGTLSVGVHTIQLLAQTHDGCLAWSDPIEITVIRCPCGGCVGANFTSVRCYLEEANGTQYYTWSVKVGYSCASSATFTVYSPNGQIVLTSPATLAGSPVANIITGIFKDPPPESSQLCLIFTITGSNGTICQFEICNPLPECDSIPCENFDYGNMEMVCMGENGQGQNVYNYSFNLNAPGTHTILISSVHGVITHYPATVLSGSNTITGTFTDTTGADTICFYISAFNPSTGRVCYFQFCLPVPECDCFTDIEICNVECAGFDPGTGYPIYYFEACLNSPISITQSVAIFSLMGTVTGQSQYQVYQGSNVISGYYTPFDDSDTIACLFFKFVYVDGMLIKYGCEMCMPLPDCLHPDTCDFDLQIVDILCNGTIDGNPAYGVQFNVNPVPGFVNITSQPGYIYIHNQPDQNGDFKANYIHTGSDPYACFTVSYFSTDSTFLCLEIVCDSLPACSSIPLADSCNVTRTAEWMYCVGTDANNNRLYLFEASVTAPVKYHIIAHSLEGDVQLPVMQLDTGYNQLVGLFIDSIPYDTVVTIIVNALHPDSLTLCYFEIEFDSIDVCDPLRLLPPGYEYQNISTGLLLRLIPNPAKESTSIVYKFNEEAENRIYIMDMQGRMVSSFLNLGKSGAIQYKTTDLPNGIYFVVAHSKNNLRLAEKLVIIK